MWLELCLVLNAMRVRRPRIFGVLFEGRVTAIRKGGRTTVCVRADALYFFQLCHFRTCLNVLVANSARPTVTRLYARIAFV